MAGSEVWFEKIKMGDMNGLVELCELGIPFPEYKESGTTPFAVAAFVGNVEVFKFLQNNGPNVTYDFKRLKDRKGVTILHLAVFGGHYALAAYLVSQGMFFGEKDKVGRTSLLVACKAGRLEMVEYLLANGCSIQDKDKNDWNSLHYAAEGGHLEIVQLLITYGITDEKDSQGNSALHFAATGGHLDIVSYLITQGFSMCEWNKNGWSCLQFAASEGHLDIVKYLIGLGCTDESDNNGGTSLMYASLQGHLEIVQYLLAHGSSVQQKAENGMTSLSGASVKRHSEIVQILINAGAWDNMEGTFPLGELGSNPSFAILEILVNEGCTTVDEIRENISKTLFTSFMQEMRIKKTNKRAVA